MMSRFVCLLFCGYIALNLGNTQKLPRVKRQSLKVQINATDDTVCMRYLRPSQSTKLEGFVLGYGSNFFSNQYIPLPSEGKNSVTELDAEPRYLVSVRPARVSNNKKSCSGRNKTQKPLQLVVGTLTPTSVFLSWGILVNPQHDWTATSNCASDRFYTVRYREKGKDKKWVFQLCPATETVIDNLKPNTPYEFGVKDNAEDSVWSKTLNHKTVLSSKKVNGQLQNMYKLVPNSQTQIILSDNKKLVPVTIIKQIIQNRTQSKAPDSSSLPGAILVHLIVPGLNESQQKLPPLLTIDDIPQASRKKLAKNETGVWPAESKTPEVQEISPQSLPAQAEKTHGPEDFRSTPKPKLVQTQNLPASNEIQLLPSGSRIPDAPKSPLTEFATQSPALKSVSLPSAEKREMEMAFEEKQTVSLGSKPSSTMEVQPTRPASHDFLHVISTPQTFTSSEIPATDLGERKPLSSRVTTSGIPEMPPISAATQRPHLEWTSSAPRETTRKAARRPRPKSTTPSSLATQQTVMASLDSNHISFLSQTSASAEISKTETVTSSADLEKPMPPFSRTPHVLTTTAVFSGIQPVLSSPGAPSKPEIPDAGPAATSEFILESFTPKTSHPFQWPRVTLAPKEKPLIPSKLKPSASPEAHHVKPAPKPPLLEPKTSETVEQPKATLAPKEAKLTTSASKPRPSARPQKPRTKPATIPVSVTSRSPYTYEHPKTAEVLEPIALRTEPPRSPLAPKATQRVPSKPKTSPKPHVPQAKDVLESITLRTDQLKPTIVPRGPQYVPSKPRSSPSPEVPRTRPASKDTYHRPSKPRTSPSPRVPPTRASPKESRRVPSKPRASPSPDVPHTKPALKEPQHIPFKPRATPIPDAPYRKPEILPTFDEPDTTMIPHIPERTKAIFAPTEKQFIHTKRKTTERPRVPYTKHAIYPTTPQPIVTKSSTTTGHSRPTMAPKETLIIPSKSKTSVGPEVPQTKPAPRATHLGSINLVTVHVVDGSKITLVPSETYHISPRPKIGQATEIPWFNTAPHKTRLTSARPQPTDKSQTRPAFSKTTLAPVRTKAPGLPKWIMPTTDDFYTPEDLYTARPIDMDVKRPPEYVDTWQKPISVTIPPGPQHPPIPPVRPTQMRRKPLPPNTVTGKPGSPAKPAGPTPPVRTGTLYKTPTAFATPEYYVDATVFSSSPTSETDSSGKPRYQAPHVKYMKKDDDVPCSITSSLEHFPQEEVGSKEEPTRPPQNPPTNLTVVTVEGCPSFVILDWEKPDNDTVTEYEVVSTENGGSDGEKEKSIITTNQTHSTVENLKPDTSYEFHVKPRNPLGEGPSSNVVAFSTESADPRVSEPISMGKDAIWTEIPFNSDTYSECKGKQYVKRTWYKKFVGVQLCNSLRYKIYLSDSLTGKFYNIGDQRGHGEDHCQFVDSFLDGRTGQQEDLPVKDGFFRAVRQEPVKFGKIGGETQINYVRWYECGTSIPGKW
ncbi:target of Nesh-SH3 isoform X24 [Serinus canaria]|uniref:target of Nesh-SH3 isoform X22 n=1 Tax=Serinus canaria TaxID=9135 RepID=UPI0021CCFE3B|nr:target of Nesh-SH3 isoform X22 [Serinus canaria]XP_050843402.1 target of Nesh-SH3 isoform X23 [Serinus canaria]XP_050843472.1 target of Nesh-SH3 isoform X24 [Serinus canaria]